MIHEETYNYLLKNVSATEFDVCLLSLLHMDWDGQIRLELGELAEKAGTTKKYLKEIVNKFISKAKGRFVFAPVEGREGLLYRFNIGKTNLLYNNKTDRYCKKYKFFYTDEFRNLPINAKRLLLMGAFRMSTLKNTEVSIKVCDIIPSVHNGETIPFTKGRLEEAIRAIQNSGLRNIVNVGIASNRFAKKEVVVFAFKKNTLQEFLENHTERTLLRKKLFEAGYHEFLSDEYCIEIERMGKYIYRSFLAKEKELANEQGVQVSAKDELQKLARFVYDAAIERIVPALISKKEELDTPKKVSAYFSSIMYAVVAEEMAKYAHQAESVKSLLENEYLHQRISYDIHGEEVGFIQIHREVEPIKQKHQFFVRMYKTLQAWCEEWVISRVKKVVEVEGVDGVGEVQEDTATQQVKKEEVVGRVQAIKKTAFEQLNVIKEWLQLNGNKAIDEKGRFNFIEEMKQSIGSYLAIHKDRIQQEMEISEVV
ncbi:hypothetical protein CON36_32090 [Bacillus cereus]|uniref:Uncharacterized protein n=1 Tax=Bacillus cereus TaxID=1396 RepID=A0A9X6STD2_BACCE|nr:hypothetical protein [Bacillus cereus]PDZ94762.1 hypothetical protein CON36_32090 [Bacillus cereus]